MQSTPYENSDTRLDDEQIALNAIRRGVVTTDLSGKITYLNDVAEQMTGWSCAEAIGRRLPEVFRIVSSREHDPNQLASQVKQDHITRLTGSRLLMRRDGSASAILDSVAPIPDADGKVVGAVHVLSDISEARALALKLVYEAHHDALTSLPNRLLFKDRLTQAISAAHRRCKKLAVLFLDLDDFKLVNDLWGHAIGDALLQSIANRLVTSLRNTDTVSRHGGDEFVILIPEIADAMDAANVAQKLLAALEPAHRIGERDLQVTASVGISIYPDHGRAEEVLIHKADTAMYRAKNGHSGGYQFFE